MWRLRALIYQRTLTQPLDGPGRGECSLTQRKANRHLAIKATDSTVSMDGICLPKIITHSHLGVTVNEKLTWDDHVSKLYTDCAQRIGILRRLRNKLNSTAFRKIFIGAIRPKIEYACAVWSGGPTGKIAKLQDAYCRRHQIHLPPLKKRFNWISHPDTIFQDETSHGAAVLVFSCACSYVRIKSI